MDKDITWAIVVSIKHHSVLRLVKKLIKVGISPSHIIVVTNVTNTEPLLAVGILQENILKKGIVGYAGSLIAATQKVVQYNPGAILVNLSSEFDGDLEDEKALLVTGTEKASRRHALFIGSTETEDGIAVWRAEALIMAVTEGLVPKKATFGELTAKLSQVTVL